MSTQFSVVIFYGVQLNIKNDHINSALRDQFDDFNYEEDKLEIVNFNHKPPYYMFVQDSYKSITKYDHYKTTMRQLINQTNGVLDTWLLTSTNAHYWLMEERPDWFIITNYD